MTGLIIILLVCYSLYMTNVCRKQRVALKAAEANWNEIEDLSDHNKNGDVVIHVRATEPIEKETNRAQESSP